MTNIIEKLNKLNQACGYSLSITYYTHDGWEFHSYQAGTPLSNLKNQDLPTDKDFETALNKACKIAFSKEKVLQNMEYEDQILDLIDKQDQITRSDLQGIVSALVLKIQRDSNNG